MLCAIWIARPEYQHEGCPALLEERQDGLGGRLDEIVLLDRVGDERARRLEIARPAVLTPGRRLQVEPRPPEPLLHLGAERDAAGTPSRIVDDDSLLAAALGVIEDQSWPQLADCSRAQACRASCAHDRLLIEIVAREMLVHIAEHRIAFQERGETVT